MSLYFYNSSQIEQLEFKVERLERLIQSYHKMVQGIKALLRILVSLLGGRQRTGILENLGGLDRVDLAKFTKILTENQEKR